MNAVSSTQAFPISVKGVAIDPVGRVLLLRNERDEWELPGGKLEVGEEPAECVVREIAEETGWPVASGPLLDVWMYHVLPGRHVFIVTYGCPLVGSPPAPQLSDEHKEIGLFAREQVIDLPMPEGYKRSIATWYRQTLPADASAV